MKKWCESGTLERCEWLKVESPLGGWPLLFSQEQENEWKWGERSPSKLPPDWKEQFEGWRGGVGRLWESEVGHTEFGNNGLQLFWVAHGQISFFPHLTEEWFKIRRVLIIYLPKADTVPRWYNGFHPRFLDFALKRQMPSLAQSSQCKWGGKNTYTPIAM